MVKYRARVALAHSFTTISWRKKQISVGLNLGMEVVFFSRKLSVFQRTISFACYLLCFCGEPFYHHGPFFIMFGRLFQKLLFRKKKSPQFFKNSAGFLEIVASKKTFQVPPFTFCVGPFMNCIVMIHSFCLFKALLRWCDPGHLWDFLFVSCLSSFE